MASSSRVAPSLSRQSPVEVLPARPSSLLVGSPPAAEFHAPPSTDELPAAPSKPSPPSFAEVVTGAAGPFVDLQPPVSSGNLELLITNLSPQPCSGEILKQICKNPQYMPQVTGVTLGRDQCHGRALPPATGSPATSD